MKVVITKDFEQDRNPWNPPIKVGSIGETVWGPKSLVRDGTWISFGTTKSGSLITRLVPVDCYKVIEEGSNESPA